MTPSFAVPQHAAKDAPPRLSLPTPGRLRWREAAVVIFGLAVLGWTAVIAAALAVWSLV